MTSPNVALPDEFKQAESLGFTFRYLGDDDPTESISFLLYGSGKVGKTALLGSMGTRTLIINIANGIETLKSKWAYDRYYKNGWPIITDINEERDKETGIFKTADAFDKVTDAIDFALAKFPERFDWIAVDDATKLRSFAMNKGLEVNADFKRSETLAKAKKLGGYAVAQQDWAAEMDLISKFIAGTIQVCKTNKKHFVLTAHERHIYKKIRDTTGKIVGQEIDKIRPAFTGQQYPDELIGEFDVILYLQALAAQPNTIYQALTEDSKVVKAGTRFPGVFPKILQNPNLTDMLKAIRATRINPKGA